MGFSPSNYHRNKGLDAEQPDPEFLKLQAEKAQERFQDARGVYERERKAERRRMSLPARLQRALDAIKRLSTVPAAQIEAGVHGGERDFAPKPAETLDVSGHLRVIQARVEAIEEDLDVAQGLARSRDVVRMHGFEKDRIIIEECEGMRAEDVAEAYPYLGSERTIRRIRSLNGRRGVDGTLKPDENGEKAA